MENENTNPNTIITSETPTTTVTERPDGYVPVQDLNNVVEETKELRKKKAESEAKLAEKEIELAQLREQLNNPNVVNQDVVSIVKSVIQQERASEQEAELKKEKDSVLNEFKSKHPIFNEANDPDGSKFSAVMQELETFDLSKANTKEMYKSYLDKAARLVGVDTKITSETITTPSYSPTPSAIADTRAVSVNDLNLSQSEKDLAAKNGISEKRFAELKSKGMLSMFGL